MSGSGNNLGTARSSRLSTCPPMTDPACLTAGAFTSDRIAVLQLLASQAAISLEHAQLYADLQQENIERRRAQDELRRSEALREAQSELAERHRSHEHCPGPASRARYQNATRPK
jgi:GAF domain-containing protein